ncbi:PREDICTED: uncharacterized protein LOC104772289 isoform X1 [Camelina sativa]|uniref:Uncharacterized protein LOC104772289 isoform X1 n=1 Tax=Camelina sativa TaxID=90675 RepID=A0ABM1RGD4_CAMSA|nr:PREDICTED: uncharacterized protein LOC104772289 isoform X1 [Camelina sativa]
MSKIKLGSSGQANSAYVAGDAVSWAIGLIGMVKSGRTASVVSSTLGYAVTGFGGVVLVGTVGYGKYCFDRLRSDIGMRSDATKVPVERLVSIIEIMEGRSTQVMEGKSIEVMEGRSIEVMEGKSTEVMDGRPIEVMESSLEDNKKSS